MVRKSPVPHTFRENERRPPRDDASDTGDWISERNPKVRTSFTPKPTCGWIPVGKMETAAKILRDDASDTGDWISERNPKGRTSCMPKLWGSRQVRTIFPRRRTGLWKERTEGRLRRRDDASDTGDWISERNPKGRTSCTPKLWDPLREKPVHSGRSIIRKTLAKQKEKGNLLPKTRKERPRDGIKEIQKADLTLGWNS